MTEFFPEILKRDSLFYDFMQFDLTGWIRDEMERVLSKAVVQEPDITDAKLAVLVKLAKTIGYNPEVTVRLKEGQERINEKMQNEANSKIQELKYEVHDLQHALSNEQDKIENYKKNLKAKRIKLHRKKINLESE